MADLKINITAGGGDTAATEIKKITTATGGLAQATKGNTTESEKSSTVLQQLASRNGDAREAIEGLTAATQGGTVGIFGMAKGIKALTQGLSLNPFSFLLGAALALLPVLIDVGKKILGVGQDAATAGEKADTAADGFAKSAAAAKDLGKTPLTDLNAALDTTKQAATDLLALFDSIQGAKNKIEDAQQAVELAQIAANPDLSPEQRKAAEFGVREKFSGARAVREQEARAERVRVAQESAGTLGGLAAAEEAKRAAQADRVAAIQADAEGRPARTAARIAALESERAALQKKVGGNTPEANARGDRMLAITQEIAQVRASSAEREAAGQSPGAQRDFAEQKANLKELTESAKKARDAAREAEAQFTRLASAAAIDDATAPVIRGLQSRAGRIAAGLPEPASSSSPGATVSGSVFFGDRRFDPFGSAPNSAPLGTGSGPGIQIGEKSFAPVAQKLGEEIGAASAAALERSSSIIINGVTESLRAAEARIEQRMKNARN